VIEGEVHIWDGIPHNAFFAIRDDHRQAEEGGGEEYYTQRLPPYYYRVIGRKNQGGEGCGAIIQAETDSQMLAMRAIPMATNTWSPRSSSSSTHSKDREPATLPSLFYFLGFGMVPQHRRR